MAEMPRMRKRWLKAFSDFREDANRWMEQGSGWEILQPEEEIRGHKCCTERGRECQTEILEMKPQLKKKMLDSTINGFDQAKERLSGMERQTRDSFFSYSSKATTNRNKTWACPQLARLWVLSWRTKARIHDIEAEIKMKGSRTHIKKRKEASPAVGGRDGS